MVMEHKPAILIVDDDAAAIHALHAAVEGMGRVRYALSGRDALRLVAEADFDLALVDARMPGMDGFEVCRAIRAERPDVAVIFVTADTDAAAEVRALEAGAVDFITKPVNPPVVRARVGMHLQLREHRFQEDAAREARAARDGQVQKAEGLNRMAGSIAHLYNNILAGLLSNLELVQDALPEGAPGRPELGAAMAAVDRAAKLSATLLTYVGQTPGRMDPMDLSEICRMLLPGVQARWPERVRVTLDLPSSAPRVRANAEQLEQAITHLVSNAAEALGNEGGSVRLRVIECGPDCVGPHRAPSDWKPEERPYACVEVADDGTGISEADLMKVFDPFFTTRFTGRGLGLATVVGIARKHGGGVTVQSRPGHGSLFRLMLPLCQETPTPTIAQAALPDDEGGTVLLVDDEPAFRNSMRAVLRRFGYDVLEAGDGIEAVEAHGAQPGRVRCLVCDISMPRMDGWETLAELRRLTPGLPAVLISGYDQAEVMSGEHAEWPDVYLAKPFRMAELRDALRRALGARRS
jgi:CheY-like chemotaxis protein